jgi:asparagine synthase (glutamine-hydrolysing)
VPDCIEFDKETRRLLDDIHMFDVLRSDKCISSNGLEPRTPFLDRSFVQYYLSIPSYIRSHANTKKCEKFLLRTAFSKEYFLNSLGKPLLPDNIIWRKKEAFSDGVIDSTRTLGSIIEDYIKIESIIENGCYIPFFTDKNNKNIHNNPNTREKLYYRNTFNNLYPNMEHLVPYFWMPKYVEATDASARTLTIYSNENILIDETENCII